MKAPKKLGLCGIELLCGRKMLKAMEKRVNDDDISIQTVNSR